MENDSRINKIKSWIAKLESWPRWSNEGRELVCFSFAKFTITAYVTLLRAIRPT